MKKLIFYTNKQITEEFENLTSAEQIVILLKALDIMHEFNSRSQIVCIGMALGYSNYYGADNKFTIKSES